LPLIEQPASGKTGASFDRNRVSKRPIAAEQHAALLTIDTACHWLRGSTAVFDCFIGGGALTNFLHINPLSI
jgi:hypothetical protein